VAGQVVGTDTASSIDATVTFIYDSVGTIKKATDKKVQGEFVTVSLTLLIDGPPTAPYADSITVDCKLKASLQKAGEKDKVNLTCELGENFAAFPGLTSQYIQNIDNAFDKVKRVKAKSKKGKLKISTSGIPAEGSPVTCDFVAPTTTTTAAPTTTTTATTAAPTTTTSTTVTTTAPTTSTTMPS
jgi:hypothetical protein